MSNRRRIAAWGTVVAAALATQSPATSQAGAAVDGATAPPTETCLDHSAIRRTKILNGRNILFTTRSGQAYNNPLPRDCPSLQRGSIVNYGVVGGRVCAGNTFQVLWQMGLDLVPTFLCQLGMFVPVTEAEIEDLMSVTDETREGRKKRRKSSREMITATPLEARPTETDAGAPGADENAKKTAGP